MLYPQNLAQKGLYTQSTTIYTKSHNFCHGCKSDIIFTYRGKKAAECFNINTSSQIRKSSII